jgi:hypothetical protein
MKSKKDWVMAQVIEYLWSKLKALSSIPSAPQKQNKVIISIDYDF